MITTFLKVNQIFITVLLIFLGIIGLILINYSHLETTNDFIALGINCVLVIIMSIYNQNNSFLSQSSFALFFFITFSLFFSQDLSDLSFYSGYFILSIIFFQLLGNRDYKTKFLNPFDLSFLGALMIAIHPPFIPFLFAIILHYFIMGKTQLKSLILSLLGVLAAALLIFELILITNKQETFYKIWENINNPGFEWNDNYYFLIPTVIVALISIADYFQNINKQKTDKKILFTNLFLIIASIVVYLVLYGSNSISLMVLIIPLSILLTNFSLYGKKSLKEIGVWVVIFSLFLYKFSSYIELPESLNMITF